MYYEAFPILVTPDLARARAFYCDLLEAKVTFQFPPEGDAGFVSLEIGTSRFGIGQSADAPGGRGGQRFSLWVYADDCDAAVEQLRAAGVEITQEPEDQPWGERVAHVLDPDGNEVLIGQKPPDSA